MWLGTRQLPQALASLLLSQGLAVLLAAWRDMLSPSATSDATSQRGHLSSGLWVWPGWSDFICFLRGRRDRTLPLV